MLDRVSTMLVLLSAALLVIISLLLLLRARPDNLQLRGKTVFISGCDTGFGFSLAVHCAELGLKVVAGCFTDGEGRRQLGLLEGVTVVELDVTKPGSVEAAVRTVGLVTGEDGLHCLVNNAACLVFGESLWQTEVQARSQLEVNYLGPLALTRACLPLLVRAGGRVVNMISNCTECPLPTLGPYTASKVSHQVQLLSSFIIQAALLALSEVLRAELRKFEVKVVIVNPGDAPNDTPLTSGQDLHYRHMEERLSPEEKLLHGDLFYKCQRYYSKLFPLPPLKKIVNDSYYRTMETVLQSASPRPYYANSDWVTTILFWIIARLPRHLSDSAKLSMMKCYSQ